MAVKATSTTSTLFATTFLLLCLFLRETTMASLLRGTPKNDEVQMEDYIVMQMEMAWGMKEMQRYKSHKGDWPTRSFSSTFGDVTSDEEKDSKEEEQAEGKKEQQRQPDFGMEEGFLADALQQREERKRGSDDEEDILEHEQEELPRGNPNETVAEEETPGLEDMEDDDDLLLLLKAKNAARTVEEYWDTLVSLF